MYIGCFLKPACSKGFFRHFYPRLRRLGDFNEWSALSFFVQKWSFFWTVLTGPLTWHHAFLSTFHFCLGHRTLRYLKTHFQAIETKMIFTSSSLLMSWSQAGSVCLRWQPLTAAKTGWRQGITGLDGFELFCAEGLESCSTKVALGMDVAAVLTRPSTSLWASQDRCESKIINRCQFQCEERWLQLWQ